MKDMKNNFIKYLTAAGLAIGIVGTVQAIPIVGSVGFNGSFTQDGTAGDLTTATHLTIINPVVTPGTATMNFVGAGAPVSFASPIGVNGSLLPMIGQLWSVTVGLKTYTMTVSTELETQKTAIQLGLAGTGIMHDLSGALSDTAGVWQVGFGVSGTPPTASFTWQSTSSASIPDGGTTVMLLGAALSGLALLRRKLA
jgi:VPDSG-CTERM motif